MRGCVEGPGLIWRGGKGTASCRLSVEVGLVVAGVVGRFEGSGVWAGGVGDEDGSEVEVLVGRWCWDVEGRVEVRRRCNAVVGRSQGVWVCCLG